jgi:hypothetical protein
MDVERGVLSSGGHIQKDNNMQLIDEKRPESVVDVLAVILIAPAIVWMFAVCWVFGGNQGALILFRWLFAERDSSNHAVSGGAERRTLDGLVGGKDQ